MITSPCCICHEPMNTNTAVGINGEGVAHPACHSAREAARLSEEVAADMERMKRVSRDLRQCSECPNCRWPMPPDNDHDICECCSFQVSYNVVEGYLWDGTWWFKDGRPPEIVERLQARAEAAEDALARKDQELQDARIKLGDEIIWRRKAEAALALQAQELDKLHLETLRFVSAAENYRLRSEVTFREDVGVVDVAMIDARNRLRDVLDATCVPSAAAPVKENSK